MSALIWGSWGVEWALEEKVAFNGFDKTITVNDTVTNLDIASDVYSAWVRWSGRETRFLLGMRYSGFDAIPGGRTGATFFLINGWKLFVDLRKVKVTGVLYSEDYDTAYWDKELLQALYPVQVSSVVVSVNSGGGGGSSPSEIWSYNNRSLTTTPVFNGPSVTQIRQEIDSNSTKLSTIVTNQTTAQSTLTIIDDKIDQLTSSGLSPGQITMLTELYEILGLSMDKPLIVTENSRIAGTIKQNILTDANQTIVTRET